MQIAPEIIFHDVDRSEWVENYIVERLGRLEKFAEGITRCHVTLAQEVASHSKGNRYSVMVEVRLPPNQDLAAKKQKVVREMHTQLPALINQAFGAIETQLKKTAQLRRSEMKTHDSEARGLVASLSPEGFGFIRSFDNQDVYFHRNSVLNGDWKVIEAGSLVAFAEEQGDRGPQASSVRLIKS